MKTLHLITRPAFLAASLLTPAFLSAATFTWDGGGADGLWTNALNWNPDTAPDSAITSDIVFGAASANNATNPGGDFTARTITFQGATAYSISGGTLFLEGQGNADATAIFTTSSAKQTVNSNIQFTGTGAGGSFTSGGDLVINGNIELNGKGVRFGTGTDKRLELNGVISNGGAVATLAYTGNGLTYVNGLNTYNATTIIWSGAVIFSQNGKDGEAGAFGNNTADISLGTAGLTRDVKLLAAAAVEVNKDIYVNSYTNGVGVNKIYQVGGNTAHTSVYSGNIYLGTGGGAAGYGVQLTAANGGRVNVTGNIMRRAGTLVGSTSDTVTKVGAGVVALSGSGYTYQGNTDVQAGTFLVNGILGAAGTGVVTVQSNATLGGSGTINRAITIQAGGVFSPGDVDASFASQVGTLTVGADLTFSNSSLLKFDLGAVGASDTVNVTGNLTLDGTLDVTGVAGFGAGQYRLFSYTGTVIDNTLLVGSTPLGYNYALQISEGTKEVFLNVSSIPEPATTAALVGASGLLLAALIRRRR